MAKPVVTDTGSKIVAMVGGRDGNTVEITDKDAIEAIRKLLTERQKRGIEITMKLKDGGLHAAKDDEETVVTEV
jgi:hypothetical protein